MAAILITGGAGFIGSNLADGLLDAGHEVVILDDLSSGKEANLEGAFARGATLEIGDIRDGDTVMVDLDGDDLTAYHFAFNHVIHLSLLYTPPTALRDGRGARL